MKTLQQIFDAYEKSSEFLDGLIFSGKNNYIAQFVKNEDLPRIGLPMQENGWESHEFTRENVLEFLRDRVERGFDKGLKQRGISSGEAAIAVEALNWILEEGLQDFDYDNSYAKYGLPIFKATALKYGFDNPIGDDVGNEDKYSG